MRANILKSIGIILLAVIVLIVTQTVAVLAASLLGAFSLSNALCNVAAGIFYAAFALIIVWLISRKLFKNVFDRAMLHPRFSLIWGIVAVMLPVSVIGIFLLMPGQFIVNTEMMPQKWLIMTSAIFFYGIGTGIAEEAVFRGMVYHWLKKHFGIQRAVFISAGTFALIHLAGQPLSLLGACQMLIAIFLIGILLALVTEFSQSIWPAALMHAVWNMTIIGNVLMIAPTQSENALVTYVIENKNPLMTGGSWGIEASIIVMGITVLCIVLALFCQKHHEKNGK